LDNTKPKNKEGVSMPSLSELLREAIEDNSSPFLEAIDKQAKAGLTWSKVWAFLEDRLKIRGKGGSVKQFKVPLGMVRALREEAKKERITAAALMRRALTIYLELKPEERERLIQELRGRWWNIDYLIEHLEEVEEAYKRELAREQKRTSSK
jgi:hypothetical protein